MTGQMTALDNVIKANNIAFDLIQEITLIALSVRNQEDLKNLECPNFAQRLLSLHPPIIVEIVITRVYSLIFKIITKYKDYKNLSPSQNLYIGAYIKIARAFETAKDFYKPYSFTIMGS